MDNRAFRKVYSDLPTLFTERTVLKKIEAADAWDMFAYASLEETSRYLLWAPHINIDESRGLIEYLRNQYKRGNVADWGVYSRSSLTLIGTVGFVTVDSANSRAEMGYVLSPKYQGRGLMGEAVERVLDLGFGMLELNRVELRIMEGNLASVHFAESHGFVAEGRFRNELLVKGAYRTILHYALLASDRAARLSQNH